MSEMEKTMIKYGIFKVALGWDKKGEEHDNWADRRVRAKTATEAIAKVKLRKNEFVVGVELIARED